MLGSRAWDCQQHVSLEAYITSIEAQKELASDTKPVSLTGRRGRFRPNWLTCDDKQCFGLSCCLHCFTLLYYTNQQPRKVMEKNEVSLHQLKIWIASQDGSWFTNKEMSEKSGIKLRTVHHHCLNLVKLGLFDQAEVFPSHRYRLSEFASKRNTSYVNRLNSAKEVFGL
jgi:DNA-binding CsgD family transcriptional regulator